MKKCSVNSDFKLDLLLEITEADVTEVKKIDEYTKKEIIVEYKTGEERVSKLFKYSRSENLVAKNNFIVIKKIPLNKLLRSKHSKKERFFSLFTYNVKLTDIKSKELSFRKVHLSDHEEPLP